LKTKQLSYLTKKYQDNPENEWIIPDGDETLDDSEIGYFDVQSLLDQINSIDSSKDNKKIRINYKDENTGFKSTHSQINIQNFKKKSQKNGNNKSYSPMNDKNDPTLSYTSTSTDANPKNYHSSQKSSEVIFKNPKFNFFGNNTKKKVPNYSQQQQENLHRQKKIPPLLQQIFDDTNKSAINPSVEEKNSIKDQLLGLNINKWNSFDKSKLLANGTAKKEL
ncbi:MAG: hypothetical protein MHPSP_002099, partial [Paramarteilia canceri]